MNHINRSLLNLTFATALSTLATGTALAEPAAKAAPTSFKDYDSNGDGTVSPEEFRALGGNEQTFRKADANSDNTLSSEEFAKASATNDRLKAGKLIDDAWITTKVKTLLLKDEGVKGLDVKVETHKGMVLLSGWVNDRSQIAQAEKIARGVEGVKMVSNDCGSP
jgi:hyperosmotically inducible protein